MTTSEMDGPLRVLITGANGLIGSAIARALADLRGTDHAPAVRCLVRRTSDLTRLEPIRDHLEMVVGDLTDRPSVAAALRCVDVVVHCAGVLRCRDPRTYYAVNRDGSRTVAEAAAASGSVRLIIAVSSQAAAGPSTADAPRDAAGTAAPVSEYGRSKLAGEMEIRRVAGDTRVRTVVLRPAAVYGPGDRDMFVYFRTAARGFIPAFTRSFHIQFAYLPDVARLVSHLAVHPERVPEGTYFIAEPRCYTLQEVAGIFSAVVERPVHIVRIPAAIARIAAAAAEWTAGWQGKPAVFNRDKLRELLCEHWTCRSETLARYVEGFRYTPLAVGAAETWRWYRTHHWI